MMIVMIINNDNKVTIEYLCGPETQNSENHGYCHKEYAT